MSLCVDEQDTLWSRHGPPGVIDRVAYPGMILVAVLDPITNALEVNPVGINFYVLFGRQVAVQYIKHLIRSLARASIGQTKVFTHFVPQETL